MNNRNAMIAAMALVTLASPGAMPLVQPEPRKPKPVSPTRDHIYTHGKPPINGSREVARRKRQMDRAAAKTKTP